MAGHLVSDSPYCDAALPKPAAFISQWGPLDFVSRWFDQGENNASEDNLFGPGGYAAHPSLHLYGSVLTWTHHD